ncbi:hypothetical protein MyxoNM_37015 [Myxococcus xanthus]|nr:hypothetical protein MyxoNM_37015 [Myxococcus xanthus]
MYRLEDRASTHRVTVYRWLFNTRLGGAACASFDTERHAALGSRDAV